MYQQDILYPFHRMALLYNNPNVESENWRIRTFTISYPKDYYVIFEQGIPAGTYVSLTCKHPEKFGMGQSCMMSDTPMEKFTNQRFLNNAEGDVLIAGLGIGMLPAALAEKEDVKSITIIELNQEVIDLVEPLIRKYVKNENKIKIIQGDAYWYPHNHPDERYDFVYLDIWDEFPGAAEDLEMLDEMIERYVPICPSCRIDTWGYEFAEAGCDDSPIEVDAYGIYLKDMYRWEEKLGEEDYMGRHEMISAALMLQAMDIDVDTHEEEIDGQIIHV